MKIYFAIICSILLPDIASGQITLEEVIANQKKSGNIVLKQGYKGHLKILTGKELSHRKLERDFEFTHAALNDKGPFLEAPIGQGICVGIDVGPKQSSYRMTTIYSKELPDPDAVSSAKSMDELTHLLGTPRSTVRDGSGGASTGWDLFSIRDDGALDVISVLAYCKKDGEIWHIDFLRVAKGVFRPTGAEPRLEIQAEQVAPRNR